MKKIVLFLLLFSSILVAQDRKIKAGDAIEIVVYGHQELSRVVSVSSQGTIDFPFFQGLPVDGLTLERLREIIVAQLKRYLEEYPVVTVSFASNNMISVNVMGMVGNPGIVQIPLQSTLQGALAMAGGVVPGARMDKVRLMRSIDNVINTNHYNLEQFLIEGDLSQNPVLKEGDVILVIGNTVLGSVKVLGEVRAPGVFESFVNATVFDMILQAGGTTDDADMSRVQYITPARKRSFELKLDLEKYVRTTDYSQLPMVKAGDIIFVPKKKRWWSTARDLLRDVSTVVMLIYYFQWVQDRAK
ncbi:SLBB domain-containing protein [candidate division KSB1 bacterium]|nr:SLBB domain-containing protein [candidate division KSB1 bacterium]